MKPGPQTSTVFTVFTVLSVLSALCLALTARPASAASTDGPTGRRVALVVGNSDYGAPALNLNSPELDVTAVETRLQEADFDDFIVLKNAPRGQVIGAFGDARGLLGAKAFGSGGLSQDSLASLKGTIVSYAATPGSVAYDGKPGFTSPYTPTLIDHWGDVGTDLPNRFMAIRGDLVAMTKEAPRGAQRSEEVSSLSQQHRFYFAQASVKPPVQVAGPKSGAPDEVSSAPASEKSRKERLLLLDFQPRGVKADLAATVTSVLGVHLGTSKTLEIVTGTELRQVIDAQTRRSMSGCDNETSCMAELAGATGARYIITGDVAKLGSLFVVTASLVDTYSTTVLKRSSVQIRTIEEIPTALKGTARSLLAALGAPTDALPKASTETKPAPKTAPAPPVVVASSGIDWGFVSGATVTGVGAVVLIGGVAAIVAGGIPAYNYSQAISAAKAAGNNAADFDAAKVDGEAARNDYNAWGRWALGGGAAGLVVGAAAVGVGAWLLLSDTNAE